ncbi:MAG: 30S ribosome-binding factor RbfA [Bryobacteraceae bacterium]|nr:30S ribosome-binding factor RbfA [Bryobacteraceae bacterium]
MDPRRSIRVSETLREELEELISYELSDPRISISGVAEVLISDDARTARVLLIMPGDQKSQRETIEALEHARGFIRRELAQRVDMFRLPDLRFEPALGGDLGVRAVHLLKRIRRGRPRPDVPAKPDESSEP